MARKIFQRPRNSSHHRLAYYYSVAAHPIFFAIAVLLVFYAKPPSMSALTGMGELLTGFLAFAVLPFSIIYSAWKRREVTFNLEEKEKRTRFFLPWALIFALSFLFYLHFGALSHAALAGCFTIVMLALYVANGYSKISWHTTGLSALITALVYTYGITMAILYLLLPTVALARYRLKAHNLFQLAAGVILGGVISYASFALLGAPSVA